MAGSIFNRVKTWISETLTAADINAEFNNILDNLDAEGSGGYSDNTTEMRAQTDPGEVGSESLASSLADELERLRFAIAELKGETYWYTSPVTTLASLNTAFGDGGLPPSRLVSGATTGNSSQSLLITPEGAGVGDGFTIVGSATNLVYAVDDIQYTLSSDVTVAATNAAPSTNNTALVDESYFSGQSWTKYSGSLGTSIPIGTVGSEIVSLDGKLAAFSITNGTDTEYFTAVIDNTNSELVDCKRGWYFDENGASIPAITFSTGATITLMNLVWVFLKTDQTADITYNVPEVTPTEPGSPSSGDYWYDTVNNTWKRFNGSAYVSANAVLVGTVIVNSGDECVGARSEDFVKSYIDTNTTDIKESTNTTLVSERDIRVGVFGSLVQTQHKDVTWDITTDLDTGTEANSTLYFFYLTETGAPKISTQAPLDFVESRGGYYHPHETWRCIAQAYNNSSGNLEKVISYVDASVERLKADSSVNANALTMEIWTSPLVNFTLYDGKTTKFPFQGSIVVPSGAELGHDETNASDASNVVLHLVKKNKNVVLGVSSLQHGEIATVTTTALGTASDGFLLYTSAAKTSAYALSMAFGSVQLATAGTWDTNLSRFMPYVYKPIYGQHIGREIDIISSTGTAGTITSTDVFYITGAKRIEISLRSAGQELSTSFGSFGMGKNTTGTEGTAFVALVTGTNSLLRNTIQILTPGDTSSRFHSTPLDISCVSSPETLGGVGTLTTVLTYGPTGLNNANVYADLSDLSLQFREVPL